MILSGIYAVFIIILGYAINAIYNQEKILNNQQTIIMILLILILLLIPIFLSILKKTKIFQKYICFCINIIEKTENIKASIFLWIIGFLSIVYLRVIYEFFVERPQTFHSTLTLIEYTLFWISLFLIVVIILKIISKVNITKIAKTVIIFSPFILIPVTVDLIFSLGKGFPMPYVYGGFDTVVYNYLTFYNYGHRTATIGIQIEIIGACYLAMIYIFSKTKNILKATIGTLSMYTVAYIFMALPSFVFPLFLSNPKLNEIYINSPSSQWIFMIVFHLLLIGINYILFFYFFNKERKKIEKIKVIKHKKTEGKKPTILYLIAVLIRNMRPFRSLHYIVLVFIGISLGAGTVPNINWIMTLLLFLSIFFAWEFAIIVNDIFDIGIDKISNIGRPLIQDIISLKAYSFMGLSFFVFSLFCAVLAGYKSFLLVLSFILLYSFIYSAPPFRLRKLFFIPNIIIGICSVLAVYIGFSVYYDPFLKFPRDIALLIFLLLTFTSTLKDIKDYEGDKKEQIKTIPTIFGLEKGKKIIGGLLAFSFIIVPIFIKIQHLIYISVPFAILAYFFTVKKNEKWIFILEFLFVIIMLILGSIYNYPEQLIANI